MKKIKPLGNRVLVRRKLQETSKGGILLPESSQEKSKKGEVIAVGPGKKNEEGFLEKPDVRIGDEVLFGSYAGTEVKMELDHENDFLVLSSNEILGVWR